MALKSFADGAIFAEVFGEGPPRVLALHGWARRGSDFELALKGMPALAPDLPGFGASPAPENAIGADGYADIVAEMLSAFDRPPVLVGHSFGGRVAVCLAAKHPHEVQALILTGAPVVRTGRARPPSLVYRSLRALNKARIISDLRMETIRRRRGSVDYRDATGVMREVLVKVVNESYEGQLRDIVCQVGLLWGGADLEVPVSVARVVAELVGQTGDSAELKVLDGVGHNVPVEAPDALRSAIRSYLK